MNAPAPQRLTILVGSDLHNSHAGFEWWCRQAETRQPDLLVFLGDFITRQPLTFLREALITMHSLAPACFVIPGNWDPREALVEFDAAALDGLRGLHKQSAALAGYTFAGLGGSIPTPIGTTPFEGPEDVFVAPFAALLPADVWVLHNPLHGYRDAIGQGLHVGSRALTALWEQQEPKPYLVLSGHIHEAAGSETAMGTIFVNPGTLASHSAAWIELNGAQASVEMLRE